MIKREIYEKIENKGGKRGNVCGKERKREKREKNEKKENKQEKREKKEGVNYKTENRGKLEMKERVTRIEKRKIDKKRNIERK